MSQCQFSLCPIGHKLVSSWTVIELVKFALLSNYVDIFAAYTSVGYIYFGFIFPVHEKIHESR